MNRDEKNSEIRCQKTGDLALPKELMHYLGVEDNATLQFEMGEDGIKIYPNIHSLSKVYIEITTNCNLQCKTCLRNSWEEKELMDMDMGLFQKLMDDLGEFPHVNSVMFGGFGEPTYHKDILQMIRMVKDRGLACEMVTNGTLLSEEFCDQLIETQMDRIYVSFDAVSKEVFQTLRLGTSQDRVMGNLIALANKIRQKKSKLIIALNFVAGKHNIDELGKLPALAEQVGAREVYVSNILPYTEDMEANLLYDNALFEDCYGRMLKLVLPRIDWNETTFQALNSVFRSTRNIWFMRNSTAVPTKSCRFIRERCTIIRADGTVSPCMGLLHDYTTYLHGIERKIQKHTLGDIRQSSLLDIWNSEEYRRFRQRVNDFEFSICYSCGGCHNLDTNEQDCFGNDFPTCGGCLWAQGVIQCP